MRILVTGGAGFIGSAFVRASVARGWTIANLDKMTYAATRESLADVEGSDRHRLIEGDICDAALVSRTLADFTPDAIVHLAAETHVDRSIADASAFITTNVGGTHCMLEQALRYWSTLDSEAKKARFRFLHVSTDEVFGALGPEGRFSETTPYDPRSPYSASKAASDHLVRAYRHTHGLPAIISNCSNNYGPYHFPEKLIPLTILNALEGKPIAVYGDGAQVRDWLFVDDHVAALMAMLEKGGAGETYCVGGLSERRNLEVVENICDLLDARMPDAKGRRRRLIQFVEDRPGHDRRYAIDCGKIERDLGWRPRETFETGLARTVDWYLAREDWWRPLREERFTGERQGLRVKAG
ncbi:MAG: dTDP-glucose 4,6-dehydratase [Hyphomonadaceae bacterium]